MVMAVMKYEWRQEKTVDLQSVIVITEPGVVNKLILLLKVDFLIICFMGARIIYILTLMTHFLVYFF